MSDKITSLIQPSLGDLPTKDPVLPSNVLDMFSLKGKVASVTGSSQGIGLAVAEAFAQAGADVAIWYNSTPVESIVDLLAKKYGVKVKAYKCKVENYDEVKATISQIESDFGTIDVFVANAGIGWKSCPVVESDVADYHKVMQVNVDSVYFAAKEVGAIFKKHGSGSFIITASQAGHIVTAGIDQTAYNATKAALQQITKSLAMEWVGFGRVNCISPGYIKTEIARHVPYSIKSRWWPLIPMGREGLPEELVGAYLYLASNASTFTTGTDIIIDGGYCCP